MKYQHEAIFCIVNSGYSDVVMETAKKLGARGGTVINARGTAPKDAESFFGISIQPEKEIVMILVPSSIKANLLHALYKDAGLDTPGQGIAFAMPVDSVVGIAEPEKPEKPDKAEKTEKTKKAKKTNKKSVTAETLELQEKPNKSDKK